MRRFLIWSGLAVLLGLVLAVSGYLAYDYFYARFRPVTIARNQGEIQRLLDEASWVSPVASDKPVYVIGYRDSPATQAFERQHAERLRAAGADVRILVFARPDREGAPQSTPNERTTVAELWLTRDWDLYRRWTAAPSSSWMAEGLAPADGNLARTAVVEGSRQFVARLDRLMRDAGVKPTWPLIIWRNRQGVLKACACADSRSWPALLADLGASSADSRPEPAPAAPPRPDPLPEPSQEDRGLPYPDLPYPNPPAASAVLPTPATPPVTSTVTSTVTPPRPAPRPAPNPGPPSASATPSPRANPAQTRAPSPRPPQTQPPQRRPTQPSRPAAPPRGAKIESDALFY